VALRSAGAAFRCSAGVLGLLTADAGRRISLESRKHFGQYRFYDAVVLADNYIRACQVACWYSWRMPPSRSRLRMWRGASASRWLIGGGSPC